MNKQHILSLVLILSLFGPIFSQIKTKPAKESTEQEDRIPEKTIKKGKKTLQDVHEKPINLKILNTPGVYVQEVSTSIPTIIPAETAIPAFIGFTEKGPFLPTKINSMDAYRIKFGGASSEDLGEFQINSDGSIISPNILTTPKYMMYYMLELFFANGGRECVIISVGHYNNEHLIRNEDLLRGLSLLKNEDSPTLILFPEATSSKNNENPTELYKAALAQCAEGKDCFLICDVEASNDDIAESAEKFRFSMGTENLRYGAAYFPSLQTTLNYHYAEDEIHVKLQNSPKTMVLRHLETTLSENPDKRASSLYHFQDGAYRGQYQKIKQIINAKQLDLPPSAAVAGVYVKTDATRGVWKTPANVSLNKVNAPKIEIENEQQEILNLDSSGKSINAIRSFPGKGVMVWGARTMAGNDNEWKYIPKSRLGMTIETSVKKALTHFNKSPNNVETWNTIRTMTTNYLTDLWRKGALVGSSPQQAYFVRVGLDETMTEQDLHQGKLILEIGISAIKPAEFSILRISQKVGNN